MLEVEDLNTYRGIAHIIRGISFAVRDTEVVCLVGRNGAGKTTTIDSLMGLLPVKSGKITFQGKTVTKLAPHKRAKIGMGYAPEDCGIFPDLSVGENLTICKWLAETSRKDKKQTSADNTDEKIFDLFPELRRLMPKRGLFLSGGEKKMLAIARAMALEPSILLLDEAFEGLAPVIVSRFCDAVKKIKEMGISLLIAESNLRTGSKVADRLYAIDRGEIIFGGKPNEVFEQEDVMKTIHG